VLQPAGGAFVRDRSMLVRAPSGGALVPVLGDVRRALAPDPAPVEASPSMPSPSLLSPLDAAPTLPAAFTIEALATDGLASYDPVHLFLEPGLVGRSVPALRLALEELGLDDAPHARGIHAVAPIVDVAVLAVPDLYHRRWGEQFVRLEARPATPAEPRPPDGRPAPAHGFADCVTADPPPVPSPPALPDAVLRVVVEPPAAYDPQSLVTVAGAVADLCAARADMIGVLGMPRHSGLADADYLVDVLGARPAAGVDPLSYVGLWHPWGAVVDPAAASSSPLRAVPPDGAVCGLISATEHVRGVWVEPAGQPLSGFVDTDPFDGPTTVALFDRGLNIVRRLPAGLCATSAHSLSADRSMLQLSVRRVLIWLRKLALREGTRFVFEPDNERFRAQVVTVFTRALEGLRLAGALVAYRVEVADLATRPAAQDGQVRVDLKVAPTSPIEFLTVTLLRSGDDLATVGGR
jgi:hypothetical protein